MGIIALIVDIIIVATLVGSIFIGWKKGLVSCFIDFIGVILVIVITFTAYPALSKTLSQNTNIDESIYNTIYKSLVSQGEMSNTDNFIQGGIAQTINKTVEYNSHKATNMVMDAISFSILFISLGIVLLIIKIIINVIAFLPIVKQFNEIGGAIFNSITMIIKLLALFCIAYFLIGYFKWTQVDTVINKTYIAKNMYNNNIIKNKIIERINQK